MSASTKHPQPSRTRTHTSHMTCTRTPHMHAYLTCARTPHIHTHTSRTCTHTSYTQVHTSHARTPYTHARTHTHTHTHTPIVHGFSYTLHLFPEQPHCFGIAARINESRPGNTRARVATRKLPNTSRPGDCRALDDFEVLGDWLAERGGGIWCRDLGWVWSLFVFGGAGWCWVQGISSCMH